MTDLKERAMPDLNESSSTKTYAIIAAYFFGLIFLSGIIAGILAGHYQDGSGKMSAALIAILAALVAGIIAICVYLYRPLKRIVSGNNDLTKRERLNRNIMMLCFIIGILASALLAILDPDYLIIANSNIPTNAAIGLAIFWGIGMPVIAYFWHTRAVDEQEAAAYRDGGYYAAYAFIIGAPTWWILARGGLVPQINGVVIFVIFNFIWLGVWFYKKYG
jgi:hypothetical protein